MTAVLLKLHGYDPFQEIDRFRVHILNTDN